MDTPYASFWPILPVIGLFCYFIMMGTSIHDTGAERDLETANGRLLGVELLIGTDDFVFLGQIFDGQAGMDFPGMFKGHVEEFETNSSMD